MAFSAVSKNEEDFALVAYPEDEHQQRLAYPVRQGWTFGKWLDADGIELLPENMVEGKTYYADWVDKVPPTLELTCSKNTAAFQEVSMRAKDIASRIYGYYVGMEDPSKATVLYEEKDDEEYRVQIAEPGRYYFSVQDNCGNENTAYLEFVRIHFSVSENEEIAFANMIGKVGDKLVLPLAEKEGYSCLGWVSLEDGIESEQEPVIEYEFLEETILKPVFAPQIYKLTLDGNGGNCEVGEMEITYDEAYPPLPIAVRTGYHFIGWSLEKDGEILPENARYEIAADSTLYAKWEPIHYIVRYLGNGSVAGEMGEVQCTYDVEFVHPRNCYTREGYVFKGWSTSPDTISTQNALSARERSYNGAQWLNEERAVNLSNEDGTVIDLYAVWQKIEVGVMDYRYCMGEYMYFACTTLNYVTENSANSGALFVGMTPAGNGMAYGTDATWATSKVRETLNDVSKNDMTGLNTTDTTVRFTYAGMMWEYDPTKQSPCTKADTGHGPKIEKTPVNNMIATEDYFFIPDLRDCYNYYTGNTWNWFWDINLDGNADTYPLVGMTASGGSAAYYSCIQQIGARWAEIGWPGRYWLRNQYTGWDKYPFYIAQYGVSSCNPAYPIFGNEYGNLASTGQYLVRPMYTMTP